MSFKRTLVAITAAAIFVVMSFRIAGADAVSQLQVTVIPGNGFRLEWEDNVRGERAYRVERKTGSTEFIVRAQTGPGVTAFQDTSVYEGTVYTYRIVLIDSKGDYQQYTGEVSVSASSARSPSFMELVPLSVSRILISWDYPSPVSHTTLVERKKGDLGTWSQVACVPSGTVYFSDNGLEQDTKYYYRIRAEGAVDVFSPYFPSQSGRIVYTPLDTPVNVYGFVNASNEVVLSWDDVDGETGYYISRKEQGGEYSKVGATGSDIIQWQDTGTDENKTYTYRVMAYNRYNQSLYSEELEINCRHVAPPSALTAESVEGNTVLLKWADNENLEGVYEIYRRKDDSGDWKLLAVLPGYSRQYSDTGLLSDTGYCYRCRVKIQYRGAYSAYSNTAAAVTADFDPPFNAGHEVIDEGRLMLKWEYASGTPLSGFRIERKTLQRGWEDIGGVPPDARQFYDAVEPDREYFYRIKAYDSSSGAVSYTTPFRAASGVPEGVNNLKLNPVSCREVEVVWEDSSNGEEGYTVERRIVGYSYIEIARLPADTESYLDPNLLPDTAYAYRVKAFNSSGYSDYSESEYIRTARASEFEDVPSHHPSLRAIEVLASRGIIDSSDEFRPDDYITRAEFTAWIVRGLMLEVIPVGSFSDVRYGHKYYTEIMSARRKGVVGGDGYGRFRPDETVARQDMCVIAMRAAEAAGVFMPWHEPSILAGYHDYQAVSSYAAGSVAAFTAEGILLPEQNMLHPVSGADRAKAADFIIQFLYYLERQ